MEQPRNYLEEIPSYGDVMTVAEWNIEEGVIFQNYDGTGYWAKDGKYQKMKSFQQTLLTQLM